MAFILSIESATTGCSVALHEDGHLLAEREIHTPYSAAAQLTVMVNELFVASGKDKNTLDAVAVSSGPGSYTGLRISLATAKGICFALDKPLIALDSLHVLASAIDDVPDGNLLCPMIDARRMEVYCCLLTPQLKVIEETHAQTVDENSFAEALSKQPVVFFGNGAEKCRPILRHAHAVFRENVYPKAAGMGHLAFQKFQLAEFADLRLLEPQYLKEFEVKTKKTQ